MAGNLKLSNGLVILETTGGYEIELIEFLQHKKVAVHRANTRLVKNFIILVQEKNRAQAPDNQFIKDSCIQIIQNLTDNIKQIETRIQEIIEKEKQLQQKVELLSKEIKGVGKITAIDLLINIPELGNLDRRKIASLSGVAPHPYESGKKNWL